MSLQRLILILRARLWVIAFVLFATVAVILVASLLLPRQYKATASVVVNVKSPDAITGVLLPTLILPAYMRTQVEAIRSAPVARRVVEDLKLDEDSEALEQWRKDGGAQENFELWLIEALQGSLNVKASRESNVIEITYTATDPAYAAAVANGFAKAYLDASVETRVQSARQNAASFGEYGKTLRENVEKAQSKLSQYQERYGIVASDERLDHETARLNELSSQLTVIQAQTADARSKVRSGTSSDTLPEVATNPLIISLKGQVAAMEGKLQEMSSEFAPNHPLYRRQDAEVASLRQKLDAETQKIVRGFATLSAVGQTKEAELRTAIEAQKVKLLRMKRQRDEMSALTRDVEAAQKAHEPVAQRFNQSALESHSTQATDTTVFAQATQPLQHSFPNMRLNTAIAIFLGTLFGVCLALILEMMQQRIRSASDVSSMLTLSVVGVIPRARIPRHRKNARIGVRREPALLGEPGK